MKHNSIIRDTFYYRVITIFAIFIKFAISTIQNRSVTDINGTRENAPVLTNNLRANFEQFSFRLIFSQCRSRYIQLSRIKLFSQMIYRWSKIRILYRSNKCGLHYTGCSVRKRMSKIVRLA